MNVQRKLQLGAAAVIANGLLALTLMAPRPAMAAACSDYNFSACGCFECPTVPGCTVTRYCGYLCEGDSLTICWYE
jgi:hypothetical protein